jgi:hypothetical protein
MPPHEVNIQTLQQRLQAMGAVIHEQDVKAV